MEETLKMMVFRTVEEHLSLRQFESWLYEQGELSNQMSDAFVLALFEFNYNQKGAKYEFKRTVLDFFDHEEFMLWKIKTNLQDLIDGRESRDRILHEFYFLGYDELPFLHSLGYYLYQLEDVGYMQVTKESVVENLKKEASELLQEIIEAENSKPSFKILTFERKESLELWAGVATPPKSKEWWQFWK
jgi:hypothetical protein